MTDERESEGRELMLAAARAEGLPESFVDDATNAGDAGTCTASVDHLSWRQVSRQCSLWQPIQSRVG